LPTVDAMEMNRCSALDIEGFLDLFTL
jgi:hypothetical protein